MYEEPTAEQFEHAGCSVRIVYDYDAPSPRDQDNLSTLVCRYNGYELGDEQAAADTIEELRDELIARGAIVLLPLFVYEHSGITMSTGRDVLAGMEPADVAATGRNPFDAAGWDTSFVGFAYTTAERVTELGAPPEDAAAQVEAEVEEYDRYLRGECFGYVIEDDAGEHLDSCWGFIGCDYVVEEAKRAAECEAAAAEREAGLAAEWAARDVETVAVES